MSNPVSIAPAPSAPLVLHITSADSLPVSLADLLISPTSIESRFHYSVAPTTSNAAAVSSAPNRNQTAASKANKAKEGRKYQKILPNPKQILEMEVDERKSIDDNSLVADINRKRRELEVKLLTRRPVETLVNQGIIPAPGLKNTPQFFEVRQRLERAKMGDFLKHKMQNRPDKKELISQRILLDNGGVEPGIGEKLALLKKYRLAEALNDKLAHRPGPLELVRGNILQVNGDLEQAVKEGQVMFRPTSTGVAADDDPEGTFGGVARCPGGGKARKLSKPIKFHEYKGPRSSPKGGATSCPVSPPISMAGSLLPVPGISHCSDSPASSTPSPCSTMDGHEPPDSRLADHALDLGGGNSANTPQCNGLTTSVTACFGPDETSPVPSAGLQNGMEGGDASTSYELLLQQQQVLLQWQLELQQKYPNTCHGAETPKYATSPADCSAVSSPVPSNSVVSFDGSVPAHSGGTPQHQQSSSDQQQHATSNQHTTTPSTTTTKEHSAKPSRSGGSSKSSRSGGGSGGNSSGSQAFKPPTRLEDMRVCDLKAECKKRNLAVSGPKPNLVERLRSHEPTILADFTESHRIHRESGGDGADPPGCCGGGGASSKPPRSASVTSLPHIHDVTALLGSTGDLDGVDCCETRTGGGGNAGIPEDGTTEDDHFGEATGVRYGHQQQQHPQQRQESHGGGDGSLFLTHSGSDPTGVGLNGDLFPPTFDSTATFASCPPEDFLHSAADLPSSANNGACNNSSRNNAASANHNNNMIGFTTTFADSADEFFGSAGGGGLTRQGLDLTPPAGGQIPMAMADVDDAYVFSDSFAIDNGVDQMPASHSGMQQSLSGLDQTNCSPMLDAHRFNGSNPVPMLTSTMLSMHEDLLRQQQTRIDELQRSLRRSQEQLKKQQQLILAAKHMQTTSNDDGSNGETKQLASANDFLLSLDTKQIQKLHIQLFLQHKVQQQRMQAQVRSHEELARGLELLREEFVQQQSTRELAHLLRLEPRLAQTIIRLLKKERQTLMQQRNGKTPSSSQCTAAHGQCANASRTSGQGLGSKSRNSSTSRKQSQHAALSKSSSMPTSPQKTVAQPNGQSNQARQACERQCAMHQQQPQTNGVVCRQANNNNAADPVDMEEIFNNVISIAQTMSTVPPTQQLDQQQCPGEQQQQPPPQSCRQQEQQAASAQSVQQQKKQKRRSSSKKVVPPTTSEECHQHLDVASPIYMSTSLAPTPDHTVKMEESVLDGATMDSGSLLDHATGGFGDIMDIIQQQGPQQGGKLDQYPNTFGDGLNFGCWPEFSAFDDCHLNAALLGNNIPPSCLVGGGPEAHGSTVVRGEEQMDWLDLILPSPSGDGNLPSDPASSSTPPSLGTLASPSRPVRTGTHDPILSGPASDDPTASFDIMHMVDVIQKTPAEELCV